MASWSELSSAELVRQCAGSRNPDAWTEFIRRFQPVIACAVLRTARRWGEPPRQLLDDLVQDTYLKLCEDECQMLKSFQPHHDDSIYGYLKKVAANVALDHFKAAMADKRGAGQIDAIDDLVLFDPKTAGNDGEAEIFRNLQIGKIDVILTKALTGKDGQRNRTIFWLRYRQGFTASEIAAVPAVGLTTEGVESVLLRLVNMIRSHMTSEDSK